MLLLSRKLTFTTRFRHALRPIGQGLDPPSDFFLARLPPCLMNALIKCRQLAPNCFERHGCRDVRMFNQIGCIVCTQHPFCQNEGSAIGQSHCFFSCQRERFQSSRPQSFYCRHALSMVPDLLPWNTHQCSAHMSQGAQVPTCSYRPVFGNVWNNTCIEHGEQRFTEFKPNSRVSAKKGVDTQGHRKPDNIGRERFAKPYTMSWNVMSLVRFNLFMRNTRILANPTAGIEPIDD